MGKIDDNGVDVDTYRNPPKQFRGTFARAELWLLVSNGLINAREFMAMLLIDSYVNTKTNLGCFAYSKTLAKQLGISAAGFDNMVSSLIKRKLLFKTGYHCGRRCLKCFWSVQSEADFHPHQFVSSTLTNSLGLQKATLYHEKINNDSDVSPSAHIVTNGRGKQSMPLTEIKSCHKDSKYAEQLKLAIKSQPGWFDKRSKPTTWPQRINTFVHTKLKGDYKAFRRVLNWYCSQVSNQYSIRVHGLQTFIDKFERIKLAMNENQNGTFVVNSTATADLKIYTPAKRIVRKLQMYISRSWIDKFSKDELLIAVQTSLNQFNQFRTKLYKLKKRSKSDLIRRTIAMLFENWFLEQEVFIEKWYMDGYQRVKDWDEWSGELSTLMFKLNSKRFQKQFCQWTAGWIDGKKILEGIKG